MYLFKKNVIIFEIMTKESMKTKNNKNATKESLVCFRNSCCFVFY